MASASTISGAGTCVARTETAISDCIDLQRVPIYLGRRWHVTAQRAFSCGTTLIVAAVVIGLVLVSSSVAAARHRTGRLFGWSACVIERAET